MKRRGNKGKQDLFSEALRGKKIPVLTLDNKWYQLLDQKGKNQTAGQVEKLNQLLKDLGKVNTEAKNIRAMKKKLMQEIISMVDEAAQKPDSGLDEKIENHKKMVEECSGRLADYEERQLELPRQIDEINFQLMLKTMEYCYDTMQANEEEIRRIADWVAEIRTELKERMIRKQELEQANYTMYSYMHDIFGMDVVDIFDMQHDPGGEENKTDQNGLP